MYWSTLRQRRRVSRRSAQWRQAAVVESVELRQLLCSYAIDYVLDVNSAPALTPNAVAKVDPLLWRAAHNMGVHAARDGVTLVSRIPVIEDADGRIEARLSISAWSQTLATSIVSVGVTLGGCEPAREMALIEPLEVRCLLSASLANGWLTVQGTSGNDTIIVGLDGSNLTVNVGGSVSSFPLAQVQMAIIYGGDGNDNIDGRNSPVPLFARGEAGDDTIRGSSRNDTLIGGDGNDLILGGSGDDILVGLRGSDTLRGGDGNDSLFGGEGSDRLDGGPGGDFCVGGKGNDFVGGGAGNDILSENNDYWLNVLGSVVGRVGHIDTRSLTISADAVDRVVSIPPSPQDRVLGDGSDTLSGGSGIDGVTYALRSEHLAISLDGKRNDGAANERDNVLKDVENVTGGQNADLIIGDDANNVLLGGLEPPAKSRQSWESVTISLDHHPDIGNDTIYGMGGNDVLVGQGGNNQLFGGAGNDTIFANMNDAVDVVDGGSGKDTAYVEAPSLQWGGISDIYRDSAGQSR
ncbi:MAG: calcium-binding protein [Tepidisphaeraceae bacterium]|jgi:hypothetical protein